MSKHKFRVYLAGPISGCSDIQVHKWRDEVKQKYGKFMDFIDPSEMRRGSPYEIVKTDIDSIEDADGMLVNMWRESIGSAIGIVHAHRAGRPVVVANPNYLNNSILEFYAAAVEETPQKAANTLLHILRADAGWIVVKSADRGEEPFSREKLMGALRATCRRARRNNIVVPALILPKVIERLGKSDRKLQKRLTTGEINDAVVASLAELEATPGYASAVKGISDKWQARRKRPAVQTSRSVSQTQVGVASGKSHSTIWGKAVKNLADIPSPIARRVFETITEVHGITRITLGPFSRKGKRSSFGCVVSESKQSFIIDGKIFDNKGVKGTTQTFQVRVQHEERRKDILDDIIARLKKGGYWV